MSPTPAFAAASSSEGAAEQSSDSRPTLVIPQGLKTAGSRSASVESQRAAAQREADRNAREAQELRDEAVARERLRQRYGPHPLPRVRVRVRASPRVRPLTSALTLALALTLTQ